jgi:hypothetical protein
MSVNRKKVEQVDEESELLVVAFQRMQVDVLELLRFVENRLELSVFVQLLGILKVNERVVLTFRVELIAFGERSASRIVAGLLARQMRSYEFEQFEKKLSHQFVRVVARTTRNLALIQNCTIKARIVDVYV